MRGALGFWRSSETLSADKGNQHRDERDAVDHERPAGADPGNGDPCNRRSRHSCRIERCGVERNGVDQILIADEFANERLPCGPIERGSAAEQECKDVDLPELDDMGDRQKSKSERQNSHCGLGDHQQLALVEDVRCKPG